MEVEWLQLFVYFLTFCGAGIQSSLELGQLCNRHGCRASLCALETWVGRWEELRGLPAALFPKERAWSWMTVGLQGESSECPEMARNSCST